MKSKRGRTKMMSRWLALALLGVSFGATGSAQLVVCEANAAPAPVDPDGLMQTVGDIILLCTVVGGTPDSSVPYITSNLSVSLNVFLGNEQQPSGEEVVFPDTVVIVNENRCANASATGGSYGACGAPDSRFQDPQYGIRGADNRIEWPSVEIPVPGVDPDGPVEQFPTVTSLRITGLRARLQHTGVSAVTAFVSLSGTPLIPMSNNVLNVAVPIPGDFGDNVPDPEILGLTTCTAFAQPSSLASDGEAETVGDVVLACTSRPDFGGEPGSVVYVDVQLQLDGPVVNDSATGPPLLFINENGCAVGQSPAPAGGRFGTCGAPDSRFQDPQIGIVSHIPNRVEWRGIYFPVPGCGDDTCFPAVTTVRIAGVRVGQSGLDSGPLITGVLSAPGLPVANNVFNVGVRKPGAENAQPANEPSDAGLTTCQTTAVPPVVRAEGIAELLGDLVFTCSSLPSESAPGVSYITADIGLDLNVNSTNNIDFGAGANVTDAVLVVNENNCTAPAPSGGTTSCGPDSTYQDPQYGVVVGPKRIEWRDVRIPVPRAELVAGNLPAITTIRISGLRGYAAELGVPDAATFPSTQIQGTLTVDSDHPLAVENNVLNLAVPILGMISKHQTPQGNQYGLELIEGFATAFKIQGTPTFTPGQPHSESGYHAPGSNNGGGASSGTRFRVEFSGLLPGAAVSVPRVIETASEATTQDGLRLALVLGANANGGGGTPADTPGNEPVALSAGFGHAIYEVMDADPFQLDDAVIPITFNSGDLSNGMIVVTPAPISVATTASGPEPEPRFVYQPATPPPPPRQKAVNLTLTVLPETDAREFLLVLDGFDIGSGPSGTTAMTSKPVGSEVWVGLFTDPHPDINHYLTSITCSGGGLAETSVLGDYLEITLPEQEAGTVECSLLAVRRTKTSLLIPYVSAQDGDDTQVSILNTTNLEGVLPGSGSCEVHYHGRTTGGGPAPATQTSYAVGAGNSLSFYLSVGNPGAGIAGAPGLRGYIVAECDFAAAAASSIILRDGKKIEVAGRRIDFDESDNRILSPGNLALGFVSAKDGFDTDIIITNTTADWLSTTPQVGSCTLRYFGKEAPSPQTTTALAAGDQLVFPLSQGNAAAGVAGAPGFEGYVTAQCGFAGAHAVARVHQRPDPAVSETVVVSLEGEPAPVGGSSSVLFLPHVTNRDRLHSWLTMANMSDDGLGSTPTDGACTIDYLGDPASPALAAQTVNLNAGESVRFRLSEGLPSKGVASASDFVGSLSIVCDFPGASVTAISIEGTGAKMRASFAQAAERLTLPRPTETSPISIPMIPLRMQADHSVGAPYYISRLAVVNTTADPFGSTPVDGSCEALSVGPGVNTPSVFATFDLEAGERIAFDTVLGSAEQEVDDLRGSGPVTINCDFPQARASWWSTLALSLVGLDEPGSIKERPGAYMNGEWRLDSNGDGVYTPGTDSTIFLGFPGATPVVGDWNGDGRDEVGVYAGGFWFLDYDGDGIWNPAGPDKQYAMGWPGAEPVVGDWNGDGRDSAGVYSNGFWFLDYDGNEAWDGGTNDKIFGLGWPGATIVIGDWNGDGRDKPGVYAGGFWFLDYDGNYSWDGGVVDRQFAFGWPGVTPIVGDWNGDGRDKAGVAPNGEGSWFMDYDGDSLFTDVDRSIPLGFTGTSPIAGDWNGDGRSSAAITNGGISWFPDVNADSTWTSPEDPIWSIGFGDGTTAVVGRW